MKNLLNNLAVEISHRQHCFIGNRPLPRHPAPLSLLFFSFHFHLFQIQIPVFLSNRTVKLLLTQIIMFSPSPA